ncbi:hypothetical protein Q31b_48850 [Novipirellula aureliae]|uniref:Uncharacterized protein n=1 Tax=Novipirellula aureliae TaxID=2527966 RepID=A0A5C6DKJ7_9BACT|nr:hypothetical protein Q31b_48850 [Novipirellula aureliae]
MSSGPLHCLLFGGVEIPSKQQAWSRWSSVNRCPRSTTVNHQMLPLDLFGIAKTCKAKKEDANYVQRTFAFHFLATSSPCPDQLPRSFARSTSKRRRTEHLLSDVDGDDFFVVSDIGGAIRVGGVTPHDRTPERFAGWLDDREAAAFGVSIFA